MKHLVLILFLFYIYSEFPQTYCQNDFSLSSGEFGPQKVVTKTYDKIYVDFNVTHRPSCYRRFNQTHTIGCASDRGGNVGTLHLVETTADIDWLIEKGSHRPYIVMMQTDFFTRDNVLKLRDSGAINGILIIHLNTSTYPEEYSADKSCPNDKYSLYANTDRKDHEWLTGSGLMFENFDFAISLLVNNEDVDKMVKCFRDHNLPKDGESPDYPVCGAMINREMIGAVDTPTCMRRTTLGNGLFGVSFCDPMGDRNIILTSKFLNGTQQIADDSVILVGTRVDGFTMFESVSPNVDSPVSNVVVLLAASAMLSDHKAELEKADKTVMFTFFAGESFDYIGSSRIVYDMKLGQFPNKQSNAAPRPISLKHLHSFIEVSQIGKIESNKIYMHRDPLSKTATDSVYKKITEDLMHYGTGKGLSFTEAGDYPLPPASMQWFLKERSNLPGILLADHGATFTNKYYNSRFDTRQNINLDYPDAAIEDREEMWYNYSSQASRNLSVMAEVLANTIYKQATGSDGAITVDSRLVSNLLYCLTVSQDCPLFRELRHEDVKLPDSPPGFDVGITRSVNILSMKIRNFLAYYWGETGEDKETCNTLRRNSRSYRYYWLLGPDQKGACYKTTANATEAMSPAFVIEDYDLTNETYPAWTESIWNDNELKMFLLPDPSLEMATFCTGFILAIICGPLVYIINKRAMILFTVNTRTRTFN